MMNSTKNDPRAVTKTENSVQSAPKSFKAQLLGGSLTLLAGSGLVGLTNLAFNVVTARLLGPTGFAHATAVYTILMLVSCITLAFQVVSAKYIARTSADEDQIRIFGTLLRRSWLAGVSIGALLFIFKGPLTSYLNLPDPFLITLLAIGTTFYIPLGVRRGYIQGRRAFRPLAVNFMLEGLVRLGGLWLLIGLGLGVRGAVMASILAVVISYVAALPSPSLTSLRVPSVPISFGEGLQAIVFFSGQTIINNIDIVLVKHFFPPAEAGFYAAVALVGRLVNMCAWSVVNTMFPVSAGAGTEEEDSRPVLMTSLLLVFGILSFLIFFLWMVPSFLWKTLFGAQFGLGTYGTLAPLLILYAVTTGVYSLSSVIITYEMSRKIANTSWLQLVFSAAVAVGVYSLHNTLRQVILVQLVLMLALLGLLIVPLLRARKRPVAQDAVEGLRLLRVLSEEQVMGEFLRSEFHHSEYDSYRTQFEPIVKNPQFDSARENSMRKALLFLRRGPMWRELPTDTKWYEVELTQDDLARIRFFPRAQWRRVADGSFYLIDVVKRIQKKLDDGAPGEFFDKLRLLSYSVQEDLINPSVLLIGIDDKEPLTILDGNHRMAAAMLSESEVALSKLRFICGLSPNMRRCCWYYTNFNTLLRYFKNMVRHFSYDAESDIGRFQESDL